VPCGTFHKAVITNRLTHFREQSVGNVYLAEEGLETWSPATIR
jgi:hypothetical protein